MSTTTTLPTKEIFSNILSEKFTINILLDKEKENYKKEVDERILKNLKPSLKKRSEDRDNTHSSRKKDDSSVNSGTSPANEHSHIPSVPKKESPRRRHRSEEGSGRRRRSRSRSSSRGRGHSRSHSKRRRRSDSRRRHSESRRHRDRSRRRISNENKDKLKKKKNVKYSSDDAKKLKHDGDRLFKEESTKDKGMLCYCESVIGYAQIVERKEMEREHMFSYFSFVFGLALKINNPELGDGIKKILFALV